MSGLTATTHSSCACSRARGLASTPLSAAVLPSAVRPCCQRHRLQQRPHIFSSSSRCSISNRSISSRQLLTTARTHHHVCRAQHSNGSSNGNNTSSSPTPAVVKETAAGSTTTASRSVSDAAATGTTTDATTSTAAPNSSSNGRSNSVLGKMLSWAVLGGLKQQVAAATAAATTTATPPVQQPLQQGSSSLSSHKHLQAQLLLCDLADALRALHAPPSPTMTPAAAAESDAAAAAAVRAAELLLQLRSCFADNSTAWQELMDDWEQSASHALTATQQQQHQQLGDAGGHLLSPAGIVAAYEQQQQQEGLYGDQQAAAASAVRPSEDSVSGRHRNTPILPPSVLGDNSHNKQQQQKGQPQGLPLPLASLLASVMPPPPQQQQQQQQQPPASWSVDSSTPRTAVFNWSQLDMMQLDEQQQQPGQQQQQQPPGEHGEQQPRIKTVLQPQLQPLANTGGVVDTSTASVAAADAIANSSSSAATTFDIPTTTSSSSSSSKSIKYEWLVFGGGGARCFAYAGALHALKQVGLLGRLRGVSGSSGGAVYALLAALDFSIAEVQSAMSNLPSESELSWLGLNKRLGLSDGAALFSQIEAAIAHKLGKDSPTLGDVAAAAGCHVSLAATSLARRAPVYLSSSSHPGMLVRDALRASCAIPFFFTPVRDVSGGGNDLLVDGCISDCTPLAGLSHAAAPGVAAPVDPSKTLVLAVHDAGGMDAPDFQGLLYGIVSTCMQAGFHHTASAGIDLLNLWSAVAAVNPLQFRMEPHAARQVIASSQALAEAFAASKMKQREAAAAAAAAAAMGQLHDDNAASHHHHSHHSHHHAHHAHSSLQQHSSDHSEQQHQQYAHHNNGSSSSGGGAGSSSMNASVSVSGVWARSSLVDDEDWQADELSSVWGVDCSMAEDDDEPLSAWWRSQLRQQQRQQEEEEENEKVDVAAAAGAAGAATDVSSAAAAALLVRPEGLTDADWALVQSVVAEQERLLMQQQQQQQLQYVAVAASGVSEAGTGSQGAVGGGVDAAADSCMLPGPAASAAAAADGVSSSAGVDGDGSVGVAVVPTAVPSLEFVVVQQDGISRVCPVVTSGSSSPGMSLNSCSSGSESEDESECEGVEAQGQQQAVVPGSGAGVFSGSGSVPVGRAVCGYESLDDGGWDHPVLLHSMHTLDETTP